jgi:hypothetical protein
VTTDKRRDANRRNALRSTGPKTGEGVLACKNNALRHGLRAVQAVVPGEDPDAWEAHRAAVVANLRPEGAVELALAEGVALKLWRLGRVARYEAELIADAQDPDEPVHAHETAHRRFGSGKPDRTDVPTREDLAKAERAADDAEGEVTGLGVGPASLAHRLPTDSRHCPPTWPPWWPPGRGSPEPIRAAIMALVKTTVGGADSR